MTVKRVLYLLVLICGLDFSLEFEQEAGSFFNYQKNDLVMKVYEIFDESLRNSSSLFKVKLKNPLSDFQAINNRSNYADVHQAAVTILKLQDTYRFKSADLARGKFNKITIDAELSFKHCFLIGKVAYLQGYHKLAVEWLLEALKNSPENEELLDYLTFSLKELGNVKEAFKINDKLLKLNPQSKVALTRKSKYFLEMQAERNGVLQILRNKGYHSKTTLPEEKFKKCCRGDLKPSHFASAHLNCRFIHNNLDFLKIAPFKFEEVHKNPLLAIYHDVLSDKEIETLKELAGPKLVGSKVRHPITGVLMENKHRVSKSVRFEDNSNIIIDTINRRLEDLTDLSAKTAEPLHVTKYGVGGFYATHHDAVYDARSFNGTGNRLASLLLFLNDVPVGAATCFPALNLSIAPKKGSAIFWYNLLDTGLRDFKLIHGGCPIAVGSKWIALKLLHEVGQTRNCALAQNNDANN